MKNIFLILLWILSLVFAIFYTYEHPEKIEGIKQYFQEFNDPDIKLEKTNIEKVSANSFSVEFSKIISL